MVVAIGRSSGKTTKGVRDATGGLPNLSSRPPGRRLRIELLACRGGKSGAAVELEICDETGVVRLAPQLARAANLRRAAGA